MSEDCTLKNKVPEADVHLMFQDAVEIERKFICESLPCALLGMNSDLMTQYIKFVADRLLLDLGYSKLFNATNPFDFMDMLNLQGKTNFFEKKVADYQKRGVMSSAEHNVFTTEADF